jgi:hypothetical protein
VSVVALVEWNLSEACDSFSLTSSELSVCLGLKFPFFITCIPFKNHHMGPSGISVKQGLIKYKKECHNRWLNKKAAKKYENFTMLLTYKIHLMQCLQQACALFLCDSVANHQILVLYSCLPPFAPPSNTSQHKRMKTTTKNCLFKFWCTCFQLI